MELPSRLTRREAGRAGPRRSAPLAAVALAAGLGFALFVAGCSSPERPSEPVAGARRAEGAEWRHRGFLAASFEDPLPAFRARAESSGPRVAGGGAGGQEAGAEDDLEELELDDLEELELDDLELDDLELDEAGEDEEMELEEPEPPEEAPVVRPRPGARPRRPQPGRSVSAEDVLRDLSLDSEAAREQSRELVRQAESLKISGELVRAERLLERALALEPDNREAEILLADVRQLLGDSRGETAGVARDFFNKEKLAREMMRTEVRRAIALGMNHEDLEEYDRAIQHYSRAIEMIRAEPFDLRLDQELREAEYRLKVAREKQARKEEADRRRLQTMVDRSVEADLETNLDYINNQIRELRRRAESSVEARNYERAAELYGQILEINPRDEDARRGQIEAKHRAHVQNMDTLLRRSVENYERAVIGVEESSIVYQQIFRYPDREEWLRISPKVITIEEQVARTQTEAEKEIRRKLELPRSFGVPEETPLRDVLSELQNLTDINFFVVAGDLDDPGEQPIQLEQLEDLPVRNLLNLILRQAGEDIGYIIKEGAVVIGPREELQEPRYYQSYEISDLIRSKPDFKAPGIALDELQGRDSAGGIADIDISVGDEELVGGPSIQVEDLLRIIGKEISGEEDIYEPQGINIYGGKLSALVTLEEHQKIAKILDRFRKATGMMVTVESRFLDIQDNFLEELGVNFGGTTSNLPNTIPDIDGAGTALAPGYEFIDAQGQFNLRAASIGMLSDPLGSQVNPFNMSSTGGGAYQLNVLDADRFQLEAILTAVAKTQEVRRLNSPRVTAFNTQTAHTLVVRQAAFIQDLEVNQTGVIPVINPVIGVLNTGSILELRPTISYDRKYVVLEIQPTLAEEIGRDVAVLNLSGNFTSVPVQLPIISVTKIKTTVTVPDGGTVLVGGLKREIRQKSSIGMPFVRHIPLVNLLFGRRGEATLRSNLFVLINANITIVHEEEAELFGTTGGV